ncbi:Protein NLP-38 a [Aphelenchoides avenae]|nr:Protein NLP-38 a [Aphelenchus avenae]
MPARERPVSWLSASIAVFIVSTLILASVSSVAAEPQRWNNAVGLWGKRSMGFAADEPRMAFVAKRPADQWNKLNSLWGKRSAWQQGTGLWGKR